MADSHGREQRLSELARMNAGRERREDLARLLERVSIDSSYQLLSLIESDSVRRTLLTAVEQRHVVMHNQHPWAELGRLLGQCMHSETTHVVVHLHDSELIGLLRIRLSTLTAIVIDLLKWDGNQLIISDDSQSHILLIDLDDPDTQPFAECVR
jgi:hypothetical protein